MIESRIVNGITLTYQEEGTGQPLLFIPGIGGDYRSWALQQELFSQSYRTISMSRRYQFPNQGQAGGTSSIDENVEDLVALIHLLGIGPLHLVGHSYGAYTALIFTRKYPQLVKTLTLIEPPILSLLVKNPPGTPPQLLSLLLRKPSAAISLAWMGLSALAPAEKACKQGNAIKGIDLFMTGVMGGKTNLRSLPDSVIQQNHDNAPTLLAELDLAGLTPFSYKDAEQIHIPTLLVHGDRSPSLVQYLVDQLAHHFPKNELLVVPGVSHFVHWENPAAFNQGLTSFLSHQQ